MIELDLTLIDPEADLSRIPKLELLEDGYRQPLRQIDSSGTSAWWQDMLGRTEAALYSKLGENPQPSQACSVGGIELESLDPYHIHINYLSETLQERLSGEQLTFLLVRDHLATHKEEHPH